MQYQCSSVIPIQQGQSGVFYVNLPSQSSPVGPTTGNDQEPFDLTGATEIVASFPNIVSEKLSLSQIAIQGAAGAGKIKVMYSALDSLNMQANPVPAQNQDLQVIVTTSGALQIDTLSIPGGPTANTVYSMTLNGQLFTYTAIAGDTSLSVLTNLLNQMNAYQSSVATMIPPVPWNISGATSGSGNTATLILTSTFAGLAFTDAVVALTKVATQANSGTIAVFLFKFALRIEPQSFVIT